MEAFVSLTPSHFNYCCHDFVMESRWRHVAEGFKWHVVRHLYSRENGVQDLLELLLVFLLYGFNAI